MERWASCPGCDRSVRLTESELGGKRGFCAACDAQFEIRLGEVRDQEHPFRALAPVELAPLSPAPQRWLIETREGGAPGLEITARRAAGWILPMIGTLMSIVLMVSGAEVVGDVIGSVAWLLFGLGLGTRALRPARLELRDGHLCYRRAGGLRWTRIPVGEIRSISPESRQIRVVWSGGERVIGRGLGQDEATMLRVAQWIEHQLANAPVPARTLSLPSPTE
jgi:hypothetical protein